MLGRQFCFGDDIAQAFCEDSLWGMNGACFQVFLRPQGEVVFTEFIKDDRNIIYKRSYMLGYSIEDIRELERFKGYFVTRDGKLISTKGHKPKFVKEYYSSSTSGVHFKRVHVSRDSVQFSRLLHRFVYEAFYGKRLKKRTRLYFIDGNCLNCSYDNLTHIPPEYKLEKNEVWLEGYEGRYFTVNGEIYSCVGRETPKKLKPSSYFVKKKYVLYQADGTKSTVYVEV